MIDEPNDTRGHITRGSVPESEQRLLGDEEEKASTIQHHGSRSRASEISLRTIALVQAILIALLLGALVVTYALRDNQLPDRCARFLNGGTPMREAIGYKTREVNVTPRHHSQWRRPPGLEVEVAWHEIARENLLFVTDDEVRAAGKDPSKVVRLPPQYEDRYGSGALALTEYGVQLSCLNWLRVYIHQDYYRKHDDFHIFEKNSNETLLLKLDHCIEVIRDALMCNAGTSIITQIWIQDRPRMIPDLHLPKKTCKDFEALVQWTKEREIEEMAHPVKNVIFGHHNPVQPQPTEYVYTHVP